MADGKWRTLQEISEITGDPEASVSARLRDLRKFEHGSNTVSRRPLDGTPINEYQVTIRTTDNLL